MVGVERVIEEIAYAHRAATRSRSASATSTATTERNVTPYHQTVEDNVIHELVAELEQSADYARAGARRSAPSTRRARSSSAAWR